ncbi:MAG TPA: hypothetical protein VFP84_05455 [Kofleriaceae bacterium]|nr:hypothetical protein [Kofleriaceae bacterium]
MATEDGFAGGSGAHVETLIEMAAGASVEYACLPYLRATRDELRTGTPTTSIDPDMQAWWRTVFGGALTVMQLIVAEAIAETREHPDRARVYSGLLVFVEALARHDGDGHDRALAVLKGARERDDAVRDMIAAARARDEAALAAAAQVAYDPALVAELDAGDRVDAGEVSLPLPRSARPSGEDYFVRDSLDRLVAFYTCWAQRAGWLREMVLDNERWKAMSFRRAGATFDIRMKTWVFGENLLTFEWPAGTTATRAVRAVATPALPPVTRARPPVPGAAMRGPLGEVDALLADGGLVFAAKGDAVWLIDPAARTSTLFAGLARGNPPASVRGLAADGPDLLVRTSVTQLMWRIDATGAHTRITLPIAGFVRAFAYLAPVAYFACDNRILAVVLSTGEATELGTLPDIRALCARDGVLYVAAGGAVHALDLATRAMRPLVTLAKPVLGLASDGAGLYTLHDGGIGRVDLATSAWTQIAGMPELGAGNYLAMGREAPADGIAERAIIDSARLLSYDAGGLWFSERTRLRRLALAERHVTSLEL